MNRFFLFGLLTVILLGFSSCSKECWHNARVIEFDMRKCACCGGLVVAVDGKTYQAFVYPEALSPEIKKDFPYDVNIRYRKRDSGDGCSVTDGLIDITAASY